jgi:hypothetical protein
VVVATDGMQAEAEAPERGHHPLRSFMTTSISVSRPQLRSSVNLVLGTHRKAECSTALHNTSV